MSKPAGNPKKDVNGLGIPKPQKRTSHWNILFVGDHGKVISVGRFKSVAVVSTLIIAVVLAVMLWLFYLYKSNARDNTGLKNALQAEKQKTAVLRNEKDLLMVRLVLAESKINAGQVNDQKKVVETKPVVVQDQKASVSQKTEAADLNITKTATKLPEKKPVLASAAATETAGISSESEQIEEPKIVGVEKLTVVHETDTNRLKAAFVLRKSDPKIESISGRAFVILKNNTDDQKQWLTIPSVSLVSGKPSQIYRGQYFSIARFKPMKFERKVIDPSPFQKVNVFIFSKDGKLLLEKELPVTIQSVLSLPGKEGEVNAVSEKKTNGG